MPNIKDVRVSVDEELALLREGQQRLCLATEFEIMPEFWPQYGRRAGPVTLRRMKQMDGSIRWGIYGGGDLALAKDGTWDYEPMPSSRTDEYLAAHRWASFDDAWVTAENAAKAIRQRWGLEHAGGIYEVSGTGPQTDGSVNVTHTTVKGKGRVGRLQNVKSPLTGRGRQDANRNK